MADDRERRDRERAKLIAKGGKKGRGKSKKDEDHDGQEEVVLKMKEKRLSVDMWLGTKGVNYKGSHFPIVAFFFCYLLLYLLSGVNGSHHLSYSVLTPFFRDPILKNT